MSEPWSELGRWTWTLFRRVLPERLLRSMWKNEEVLSAISVVHWEQWPRFYVRQDREPPELDIVGFNLFNLNAIQARDRGSGFARLY